MKVLQITTNYPCKENPIFGIFMKEQVESLEPLGVENTIFFSNGLNCFSRMFGAKSMHALSSLRLRAHLLRHKYDVIHCHSVVSGLILKYSGYRKNNCVLSLQNDPTFSIGSDSRYFEQLYPIFRAIIIKTPSIAKKDKLVYLPNGVNLDFFKPLDKVKCKKKLGLDLDKRYVLFVDSNTGKNRTQKRRDRFDAVIEILRNKYGYGDIEPLVMIGVEREHVPIYMNACDLHLLTSDQEGSPNSVKECMACNVPCVTTPVGNIADLFANADGCYMANDFEPDSLAVLADKVLRSPRPTALNISLAKSHLDWKSIAQRLMAKYSEIAYK